MAYILAMMVGLGSFSLYMSAFFFPEVHRKYDLVWSGVGLFYALVLWVCAGRITGGVLLGQMSSVALLGWFSWQNLQLRRDRTPPDQQTQLPDSVKTANDVVKIGSQTLKSLLNRNAQATAIATPSTATVSDSLTEPTPKSSRSGRPVTGEAKPAPARPPKSETGAPITSSEPAIVDRPERRSLKKKAQAPTAAKPTPTAESDSNQTQPVNRRETQPSTAESTTRPTPATKGTPEPSAEPQEWDEGGEWETAELPLEDALGRFSPERLNSLLEDTPSEPLASETEPIYLRAELLSEPKEPESASRGNRRRGRRSRSTSDRQLDISSPYSMEDELEDTAIAFGEASPPSSGRPRAEQRSPRRRRSPNPSSDRDLVSFSSATYEEAPDENKSVTPSDPLADPSDALAATDKGDEAIAEELTSPGNLDTGPAASSPSTDGDSEDWF